MIIYILVFTFVLFLSIALSIYQKVTIKMPLMKNISSYIAFLSFFIIVDSLRDPYLTFSWMNYRVDVMKEFSISSRTSEGVDVYFVYQIQSKTMLGMKIVYLTSEQFSNVKIGDIVDNKGNKIQQHLKTKRTDAKTSLMTIN